MGGPTGTRKLLRTKYPSFFTKYSREQERSKKYPNAVLMIDVLVALRTIAYNEQKQNNKLTGYQWAKALMQKVRYAFEQHFAGVVLCMDNEALVPPYKAEEQASRAKSRKTSEAKAFADAKAAGKPLEEDFFKPFPEGAKLVMGGVQVEEGKEAQPLTMQRLLATRSLRAQLLDVVMQCLREDGLVRMIGSDDEGKRCDGRFVIIDYSSKLRPERRTAKNRSDDWKEYASTAWMCTAKDGIWKLDYQHPFGEADLGMMFWSHVFRGYDCMHDTNDTDQHDVMLNYLEYAKTQIMDRGTHKLLLRYTDTYSGDVYVDNMRELYACMQGDNFSASCYSLFSGLGGNDYCLKSRLTDGLGVEKLFDTAIKSQLLVKISNSLRQFCVLGEHMHFVWLREFHPEVRVLKAACTGKDGCGCVGCTTKLLDKFLAAVPGKLRIGSGGRLQAIDMLFWSWQYWHDGLRFLYRRVARADMSKLTMAVRTETKAVAAATSDDDGDTEMAATDSAPKQPLAVVVEGGDDVVPLLSDGDEE